MSGEESFPYNWETIKEFIKFRDDYTCQKCKKIHKNIIYTHEEDDNLVNALPIHHIFPRPYMLHLNHAFLLIAYCSRCHKKRLWGTGGNIEEDDLNEAWFEIEQAIDRCVEKGWIESLFDKDRRNWIDTDHICKRLIERGAPERLGKKIMSLCTRDKTSCKGKIKPYYGGRKIDLRISCHWINDVEHS